MARCNIEGLARRGLLLFSDAAIAASLFAPGAVSLTPGLSRGFSTRAQFFDLLTLPSRKGIFNDAVEVAAMLPNRKDFSPQFSPHGITLVPKSILLSTSAHAAMTAAAAQTARLEAAKAHLSGLHDRTATHATEIEDEGDTMHAAGRDKTKVWRKHKMKKHKISKRRQLNRYKND